MNESKNGRVLAYGSRQTNYVSQLGVATISSSASYNNKKAKYGYAEYGLSTDSSGKNKEPGKHISMWYQNFD